MIKILKYMIAIWLIHITIVSLIVPAYAESKEGVTTAPSNSVTEVQIPEATTVSSITGGRTVKNVWSIGLNLAYSTYSINTSSVYDVNNQTGSTGYSGIFLRYGITEELMLTGEFDYLYGTLSGNITGTTIKNSYSGFPLSLNILLFVPMKSFGIYSGIGPAYLASLTIKQSINGSENKNQGYGIGAQGIIGMETYLSDNTSLGIEFRYRHINLYKNNGVFIAPLNNISMGLNLIFYI